MPSASSFDLNQVQRDFQRHRRDVGRRRIPDTLRHRVLDLLPVYPRKQVINTLGISYKMLLCWERDKAAALLTPPASSSAMTFVSVPPEENIGAVIPVTPSPELPFMRIAAVTTLELRLDVDTVLTVSGDSASEHCLQLLQGLGYGRRQRAEDSV